MKKSIILCMVLFMMSLVLQAQVLEWNWVTQAGGSSADLAKAIKVDDNGNSYVTGNFQGTVTFGTTELTSSGLKDIFVAKMDVDGNWLWAIQAGGDMNDEARSITVDVNGNSYVTGSFCGTATFGAYTLIGSSSLMGHLETIFVTKIDSDGNWQWAQKAGAWGYDWGTDIEVDAVGNSYVTGSFLWYCVFGTDSLFTSNFAMSPGGMPAGGYQWDAFVAKLDPNGNWLWEQGCGSTSTSSDDGFGITLDASDNLHIMGDYNETAYFGADSLITNGQSDIFVAKMDTDGNWLGVTGAGGASQDRGYGLSVDADGNSYVTGQFSDTATFGTHSITTNGDTFGDIFVAKMDAAGNWEWAISVGGTKIDYGFGISTDANGNSYVTGMFEESATFGATTLTTTDIVGDCDVFVAKVDTDGNWLWAKQAGGDDADYGYGISIDANGNSYVTGTFIGTADFGATTFTSNGEEDIFVATIVEPILGDFNSDGYVDASDLQLFGDHWHYVTADPGWDAMYDLDPNGIIDAADLQIFGDHWHEGIPPTIVKGDEGKGPNVGAGIEFDLDATTAGNQHVIAISSQSAGTYIRLDVYATGVHNLDTYEFEVTYNSDELTYISSSATNPITFEQNILTTNGGSAIGWMVDSSVLGVLSIAYTLAGTDTLEAPEGDGLLGDIVFQAQVATYGTLGFGDVYYYDTFGVQDLITDTGTATLPVELSTFNAIYNTVSGFVSLFWATSSETDVNGFNIYRNTEDSFVEADKINIDLIAGSGTTTETTEYNFIDETADPYYTTYYYWLQVINFGGTNDEFGPYKYIPIDVNHDGELGIITSTLSPCCPNPSRIGNEIKFNFRVGGLEGTTRNVELKVYNILGKLVAEVVNGDRLVNDYTETWKPINLSNGVYFYQLKTDNYSEVKKMMITK